ncbi:MAG: FAD-binding oxidoreductase [Bacillota bacterium]
MTERTGVVIIGGGVIGCAIAYYLARSGYSDVMVLEQSYLASGSTGRCGAGVRQQWGTEMNCILSRESVRRFETLNEELAYPGDIEFKQRGYLILAHSEREWEQFAKNLRLQQSLGIPARAVDPHEARELVPMLNTEGLLGATFCPTDGHCNPFYVTQAYARAAARLGVSIRTFTRVEAIVIHGGRVRGVSTPAGDIEAEVVVNAAGAYAGEVGRLAGLELPVYSERHQILVTEPVAPALDPMVLSFSRHLYCQQTPHGSFIMGLGDPAEPRGTDTGHSWQFLQRMAARVTELLPPLAGLRVVRQWSGSYNISPDRQPILGPAGTVGGLFLAVGFSGHGFMLAPVVGETLAALILDQTPPVDVSRLDAGRFARGDLIVEPSVV